MNPQKDSWEAFIEEGAALEHARWSRWHMHMIEKQTPENLERWARQCLTRYAKLSEYEKESDRREVREYIPLIEKHFVPLATLHTLEEKIRGMKREVIVPTDTLKEGFLKEVAQAATQDGFNKGVDSVLQEIHQLLL